MSKRHIGYLLYEISKKDDMHFVYAFFFLNGNAVHVKLGESTTPYKRLATIAQGCPFPIEQAVFTLAGSRRKARSFEAIARNLLADQRTRGEWYVFNVEQGADFKRLVSLAYARSVGKPLKWTKIDLDRFRAESAMGASKKYVSSTPC